MIVKTVKHGECICHFDDADYIDKTEEEVQEIVKRYSEFIALSLKKKSNVKLVDKEGKL